jgi:hypothetical protein
MWLVSHGVQERGQVADVLDEQRAVREHFAGSEPVRADERAAHPVGDRGADIVFEVVTDEQHPVRGCLGCGED